MKTFYYICKYCDHKWMKNVYGESPPKKEFCLKCGDKHVSVKLNSKVDYYEDQNDKKEKIFDDD